MLTCKVIVWWHLLKIMLDFFRLNLLWMSIKMHQLCYLYVTRQLSHSPVSLPSSFGKRDWWFQKWNIAWTLCLSSLILYWSEMEPNLTALWDMFQVHHGTLIPVDRITDMTENIAFLHTWVLFFFQAKDYFTCFWRDISKTIDQSTML